MYWFKRVKNNASIRKSRMKKQAMDNVLRKKMMLDGVKGFSFKVQCAVFQLFSIPP
jgi:uncharacterized protein YggL (DUF469 family)